MAITNFYVDNNETIYAFYSSYANLGAGTSKQISQGLSDVGELPGQSTWFVNKIHFGFHGYWDIAVGTSPESYCYFQGGVIPRDLSGATNFSDLSDYQTIKGWPLKGINGLVCKPSEVQHNALSFSRTYSPRKALLLNREQNINWVVLNGAGARDLKGYLWVNMQMKRGD
jgi:hypothetical protein